LTGDLREGYDEDAQSLIARSDLGGQPRPPSSFLDHPAPTHQRTQLFSYPLKDLPAGIYEITAQIGDWSSVRASDRQTVEIH
jgi:hypothetical protein